MLITLVDAAESPRIKGWLVRRGFESKVVQRGQALLLSDPWVPWEVRDALSADPAVACIDETTDTPRRVMRQDSGPIAMGPWSFGALPIIAGPCAVESRDMIREVAEFCASLGIQWLRGGTDKTRTRCEAFQGLGAEAAVWLREAADAHGMLSVTEVTDSPAADAISDAAHVLMVGARHMHASRHLQRVGRFGKPVILKRGLSASPEEWLRAAEYLLDAGAPSVAFCERGARAAHPLKRFTLDLAAVPFMREMSAYPILVDPSHAAGYSPYVLPLARAALAAGAHGVIIECHPNPAAARSDAIQALDFEAMAQFAAEITSKKGTAPPPVSDISFAPTATHVVDKAGQR